MRTLSRIVIVVVVLGLVFGAGALYLKRNDADGPIYKTAEVKTGNIVATISATGTIEPQDVIDVGAQVGGLITSFGTDEAGKPIDYGSKVKKGMVLANIDEALYRSDAAQAQAQLDQAKAQVLSAQADLQQSQAKLNQATRDWKRAQKIGPSDAMSQADYDNYQSEYEVAQANLAVAQAAIAQARAGVESAQAAYDKAQRNLGYCIIKSPVDGVIIDRRVNIGQTVVSSLSAPSLFLIAKDLKQMEIWVAVNEADIGQIRPGLPVTYTVDAFPGRTFKGTVSKVRLNATMTQNVVTYTVVVATDNADEKLLPYLTANISFETARREGVLTVPNAALRWAPSADEIDPADRSAADGHRPSSKESAGTLWVVSGPYVRPIPVTVGLTDGIHSEVSGAGLSDGMQVVTGLLSQGSAGRGGTSIPGLPKFGHRKKK